jgi:hypothetical protein
MGAVAHLGIVAHLNSLLSVWEKPFRPDWGVSMTVNDQRQSKDHPLHCWHWWAKEEVLLNFLSVNIMLKKEYIWVMITSKGQFWWDSIFPNCFLFYFEKLVCRSKADVSSKAPKPRSVSLISIEWTFFYTKIFLVTVIAAK